MNNESVAKIVSISIPYLNRIGAALTIVVDIDRALRIQFDNIVLDMALTCNE